MGNSGACGGRGQRLREQGSARWGGIGSWLAPVAVLVLGAAVSAQAEQTGRDAAPVMLAQAVEGAIPRPTARPVSNAAPVFGGLARLDAANSAVDLRRDLTITLTLSQPVPWRVYTLTDPRRLVVDFSELDWGRTDPAALAGKGAPPFRFGPLRPGWSRLVVDLSSPRVIASAGMAVDAGSGAAVLTIRASAAPEEVFAARSGAPEDPRWAALTQADPTRAAPAPVPDGALTVAIDAGHGGIDPGASRGGVREADVMLAIARDLASAVTRQPGMRAVMTRQEDVFVPLEQRMTIARAAGADVFVSLHADALRFDQVAGASIYVLDKDAQDEASAQMAERHGRGDLLAGLDLSGHDDAVATVLMDLARQNTNVESAALQDALIAGLGRSGARLTARPERSADLAVLKAAEIPSVLVECGFLSNPADRTALQVPEGRAQIVAGLLLGLIQWADEAAARAPLKLR